MISIDFPVEANCPFKWANKFGSLGSEVTTITLNELTVFGLADADGVTLFIGITSPCLVTRPVLNISEIKKNACCWLVMENEIWETPVGPPPHGHIAPPVLSNWTNWDEDDVVVRPPEVIVVIVLSSWNIFVHWALRSLLVNWVCSEVDSVTMVLSCLIFSEISVILIWA